MSFDTADQSIESSQPRELYVFDVGGSVYRHTSSPVPIDYGGNTYTPLAGLDSDEKPLVQIGDQPTVTIDIASSAPLVRRLARTGFVLAGSTVEMLVLQAGEGLARVVWSGPISTFKVKGSRTTLTCSATVNDPTRSELPRYRCQRMCNHVLYDEWCRVNRDDYLTGTTIADIISGSILDIVDGDTLPDGWFSGGTIVANGERRTIWHHTGDRIRLLMPFHVNALFGDTSGISVGTSVILYPGCAHDIDTCSVKFDNVINYGGAPNLPLDNPFAAPVRWRSFRRR